MKVTGVVSSGPFYTFVTREIQAAFNVPQDQDFYAEIAFDWIPEPVGAKGVWFGFGFDRWSVLYVRENSLENPGIDPSMGLTYIGQVPIVFAATQGTRALKFVIRRDAGTVTFGWGESGLPKYTSYIADGVSRVRLIFGAYFQTSTNGLWGGEVWVDSVYAVASPLTGVEDDDTAASNAVFSLAQNFPNPFNTATEIVVDPAVAGSASVLIYNLLGEQVMALRGHTDLDGPAHLIWDGLSDRGVPCPSGVYIYAMRHDRSTLARKMVLIR